MRNFSNVIIPSRLWLSLRKLFNLVVFLVVGLHGWLLVFRIPHTLRVLFEAFRPGGHGINNADFWAFGPTDAAFRPWYNKTARTFHTQGRFGYAWDDGLGMYLGLRTYNNLFTYKLLYWLGTRRMTTIGCLMMLTLSTGLCIWRFGPWLGLAVGLLMVGSPILVVSYTHLGKPEVFWWGLGVLFVFAGFSGMGLLAGLLWSLLAFVNLPVSVMLAMLLGPALFFSSLSSHSLFGLIIGVTPGAVKHTLRIISMRHSAFLSNKVSEQRRVWKRTWHPILFEYARWFPFILSIAASAYTSQQFITGVLILIVGLGLHWSNYRIIYLNDDQSFILAFLTIGLGYAVAVQSIAGLLGIIFFTYSHPPFWYEAVWQRSWPNWRNAWQLIKSYLEVAPLRFVQPAPLITFLNQIPDGARILLESDGDPRTGSIFRTFTQWTEESLPHRQVDLVNNMYTRQLEPELSVRYLNNFNASKMNAQVMGQLCQVLGVSHVVAFSAATVRALDSIGYKQIAQVNLNNLEPHDLSIIRLPGLVFVLLQAPSPLTVIDPALRWERKGNLLTWTAKAGQSYIVRYRHHPNFRAYQNGLTLEVEPVKPVMEIPLTFMRVKAIADGPIALRFTKFVSRKFADMVFCEAPNAVNLEARGSSDISTQVKAAISRGNLSEARTILEQAAKDHPENTGIRADLGSVAMAQGDYQKARDHFASAIELAPGDPELHNQLGTACYKAGDHKRAEHAFQQALALDPTNLNARMSLAEMACLQGSYDEAINYYTQALNDHPGKIELWIAMGQLALKTDRPDSARTSFQRALALDPAREDVRQALESVQSR